MLAVEFGKRNLIGIPFQGLRKLAEGSVWKDFASGGVPAGAAAVGLVGEGSGGVTSDIVRLLSRAGLHWSAKVAQLLLGGCTYRRPVAVRAEVIQHSSLISDRGCKLLVGERALAVVVKSFERVNHGYEVSI